MLSTFKRKKILLFIQILPLVFEVHVSFKLCRKLEKVCAWHLKLSRPKASAIGVAGYGEIWRKSADLIAQNRESTNTMKENVLLVQLIYISFKYKFKYSIIANNYTIITHDYHMRQLGN